MPSQLINIFPSAENAAFRGEGAVAAAGPRTSYAVDPSKPLGSWKRAWKFCQKEAGVECRIHDLRHHFIPALPQTQTPNATIQAISGHLSRKTPKHDSDEPLLTGREALGRSTARPLPGSISRLW